MSDAGKTAVALRLEPSNSRRAGKVDEHIGSRIRAVRMSAGVSQDELAGRIGISCQQIQKYEGGANRVTVSRLIDIADGLGVDLDRLLEIDGSKTDGRKSNGSAHTASANGPHHREMLKLMTCFCSIQNAASRAKIMEMAEFLASFEAPQPAE